MKLLKNPSHHASYTGRWQFATFFSCAYMISSHSDKITFFSWVRAHAWYIYKYQKYTPYHTGSSSCHSTNQKVARVSHRARLMDIGHVSPIFVEHYIPQRKQFNRLTDFASFSVFFLVSFSCCARWRRNKTLSLGYPVLSLEPLTQDVPPLCGI